MPPPATVRRARKSLRERRMKTLQNDLSANLEKVELRVYKTQKTQREERRKRRGKVLEPLPRDVLRGIVTPDLMAIEDRLRREVGLPPLKRDPHGQALPRAALSATAMKRKGEAAERAALPDWVQRANSSIAIHRGDGSAANAAINVSVAASGAATRSTIAVAAGAADTVAASSDGATHRRGRDGGGVSSVAPTAGGGVAASTPGTSRDRAVAAEPSQPSTTTSKNNNRHIVGLVPFADIIAQVKGAIQKATMQTSRPAATHHRKRLRE